VKWSNAVNPRPYNLPGGIFDRCSEVAPESAEELVLFGTGGTGPWDGSSTVSGQNAITDGDPATAFGFGFTAISENSVNTSGATLTQTGLDPGITFSLDAPATNQQGSYYTYSFSLLVESSGVAPGTYTGSITFTLGGETLTVPVEVTVS